MDRTNTYQDTGKQWKSNKLYTNPETSRKKISNVGDSVIKDKDIVGVWISKSQQAGCYINS